MNSQKIFCIGLGKTGTTSLGKSIEELGFKLGDQRSGELLLKDWSRREFRNIIKLCHTADVFQDIPFCLPYTYQVLECEFPEAKFILSLRDNGLHWFNSLTTFHGKLWSKDKRYPPTSEELKEADYIYRGQPYFVNRTLYDTPETDPYNKDYLINYYDRHTLNVIEYFRFKKEKLLTINVSQTGDYLRLCKFLDRPPIRKDFLWLNKT